MPKTKANQEALPGMERRDVPEIEQAAENYRKIRDERCELSKRESEAKSALIQVMKNLDRSFYQYNGLKIQLEITDNVKVKASDDDDDDEPIGTFTQRAAAVREEAEESTCEADEILEQQQAPSEEERQALHREAVARWRRERPASAEEEEDRDRDAATGMGSRAFRQEKPEPVESEEAEEERQGIYVCQGCDSEVSTDLSATDGLCSRCWTPDAIKDPEERAAHRAENADDFTAKRCDECGRIDGAHIQECSKSNALRFDDYLAYARAHYKTNHQSHARKMDLTKLKDEEIRAWKLEQQQAGSGREPEPEKKTKGRAKLSLVEKAIDR